ESGQDGYRYQYCNAATVQHSWNSDPDGIQGRQGAGYQSWSIDQRTAESFSRRRGREQQGQLHGLKTGRLRGPAQSQQVPVPQMSKGPQMCAGPRQTTTDN